MHCTENYCLCTDYMEVANLKTEQKLLFFLLESKMFFCVVEKTKRKKHEN